MLTFIFKDLLLFWRNRKEILTVLVTPIILIVILSFAFTGVAGISSNPLELKLAIVNEDAEEAGINQFIADAERLEDQAAAQALIAYSSGVKPIAYLEQYLHSPELADWLTVYELSESEALQQLEKKKIDGWIKIPQGYTYDMLNAIMLGKEASAVSLPFVVAGNSMNVTAIEMMISEFFDQVNFQLGLQHSVGDMTAAETVALPKGGREALEGAEPFTMGQYFTLAMGALFSLFIASTVAEKTGTEKREEVIKRIIAADTRPMSYLMGKTCATFILVWLQFLFVVVVSHLLLGLFAGKPLSFWLGLLLMITIYALTVAGISAFYTSIALRSNNMDAVNGLFLLFTMALGILGGNFVPIYLFPEWLQQISEWTPNGLMLATVMEWIQLERVLSLGMPLVVLSLVGILFLLAGMLMYPKRGEA
ncbi:ABC transporter permease [Paenibacillus brevis]|uniref:ABC transporter permease n=1 Tax=Paenibacillus brevis TaxID=2841508 RepID=A0ABS6FQX4_9BACL|nr:ABC transporter permease [Paenibacillus brevis]MBU5671535.1 ABC transporter permease [Paenibacillus brevis]